MKVEARIFESALKKGYIYEKIVKPVVALGLEVHQLNLGPNPDDKCIAVTMPFMKIDQIEDYPIRISPGRDPHTLKVETSPSFFSALNAEQREAAFKLLCFQALSDSKTKLTVFMAGQVTTSPEDLEKMAQLFYDLFHGGVKSLTQPKVEKN